MPARMHADKLIGLFTHVKSLYPGSLKQHPCVKTRLIDHDLSTNNIPKHETDFQECGYEKSDCSERSTRPDMLVLHCCGGTKS